MKNYELDDVYINNSNYNLNNYISEWFESSSILEYRYIVYCTSNCDISIEYSPDKNFVVIDSINDNVVGGSSKFLLSSLKSRYVRFKVDNIVVTPCHLIVQVLYNS